MSNWISKATNAFKGDDSSSSHPFQLFCDCGQKHTGLRRQKWQRIVCRTCGGSLFVLQRDPYPPPKEQPAPIVEQVVEEEIPAPAPEADADEYGPAPTRRPVPSRPAAGVESRSKKVIAPAAPAPSRLPRQTPANFWKPFRLILVAIAFLGLITGFLIYRSSQREGAERSLKVAVDQIQDSIQAGNWSQAKTQLQVAVTALDRLGRVDADAGRYRQQLREITAMTSLLSYPLSDLLAEAAKAAESGESELATFQFKAKGQWVILEGAAEPIPVKKKRSRVTYRIALPFTAGQGNLPVEVVILSTDLSRLLAKSDSGNVVVGIQIDSLALTKEDPTWQIVAKPDATVLWTSRTTYLGIGYTPEDANAVAAILTAQAQSLGVKDDSAAE